MRLLATAALPLLAACMGRDPARLVAGADTLIVNGVRPVSLRVAAIDKSGRAIARPRLAYSGATSAVQVSADGRVTCVRDGDASITASHAQLARDVFVRCRRIRNFAPLAFEELIAGDVPQSPVIRAFGDDGTPVTLLHASASVRDTSVARIRDGRVYPVARGKTAITLDFGGVSTAVVVEVDDRVIETPVRLVGGEFASWRLPPGWFDIRLDTPAGASAAGALQLVAYHANCAHALSDGEHYYCIAKDNASVVVRNPAAAGSGVERSAKLVVLRKP